MNSRTVSGSCLCGAVAYEIRPPYLFFQYCYCSRCRKNSGSVHAANILLDAGQFKWLRGADKVKVFRMPDVRAFSTAFCTECGSAMPWQTKNEKFYLVPSGGLNADPGIRPDRNIYWASRAAWYVSEHELPSFDEGSTPG